LPRSGKKLKPHGTNSAIYTARASLLLAVFAALGEKEAFGECGDSMGERVDLEERSVCGKRHDLVENSPFRLSWSWGGAKSLLGFIFGVEASSFLILSLSLLQK
jgi:hypothetical protein